jgi:hypothetical protein
MTQILEDATMQSKYLFEDNTQVPNTVRVLLELIMNLLKKQQEMEL